MKKNNNEVTKRQVVGWVMMVCGFFIMINSAIKLALNIKKVKREAEETTASINNAFDKAMTEIKPLEVPEEHIKGVVEKSLAESLKESNASLANLLEEMGFPVFK